MLYGSILEQSVRLENGTLGIALSASSTVQPFHLPSYWRGVAII